MARRLRCPCGNIVTLPEDAGAATKIACAECKRTLSVPPAKPAAQPAAGSKSAVVPPTPSSKSVVPPSSSSRSAVVPPTGASKPSSVKPAVTKSAVVKQPSASTKKAPAAAMMDESDDLVPPARKRKKQSSSRMPLIAGLAVLLLAGGGVGAWMYFKPEKKPVAKDTPPKPPTASNGENKQSTSLFFTLTVEQERAEVSPGSTVQLTIKRAPVDSGFTGEVALSLKEKELPPGSTVVPVGADPSAPVPLKLADKQDRIDLQLKLAPTVKIGSNYRIIVVGKAKDGDRESSDVEASAPTETVVVAPFEGLKIEPATPVMLAQGAEATLTVTVTRKGGYDGPIALELKDLPKGVGPMKVEIPAKESKTTVTLKAEMDAPPGTSGVSVIGTLPDAEPKFAMNKFDVNVTAATAKTPFDLKLDQTLVKLTQGGEVVVKAIATRRPDYTGPIKVELVNLPDKVKATMVEIAAGQDMADVKLTAEKDAVAKDYSDPPIYATGATADAGAKPVQSAPIVVRVVSATPAALFEYQLDSAPVVLPQGGIKRVMVVIVRSKDFQSEIKLEVKNLPAKVTAAPVSIAKGETTANLDLTAAADAVVGDTDITLLGTATDTPNGKVESPKLKLRIVTPQGLELTVVSPPVLVRQGNKVKMQVSVERRGYDGPISVELRGLPSMVTAPLVTIPEKLTMTEIELTADGKANRGDKTDVLAVGTATALGTKEFPSSPFTVKVQGPPSFALSVDTGKVSIRQGATGNVKVTAVRTDYDGPIDIELKGLQPQVSVPAKLTIPQGQFSIDVALTVQAGAAIGDKNDVVVSGSASSVKDLKDILSSKFTVSVAGKPVVNGTFTLKADKVTIHQGGTATLKVHVTRTGGFSDAINITAKTLPGGVSAAAFTIPAGQNVGTTQVTATVAAPVTVFTGASVQGSAGALQVPSSGFEVHVEKKKGK